MVYVIKDNHGNPVKAYKGDKKIYNRYYHCGGCGWTVDYDFADYDPRRCPKCNEGRHFGGFQKDEYVTPAWRSYRSR